MNDALLNESQFQLSTNRFGAASKEAMVHVCELQCICPKQWEENQMAPLIVVVCPFYIDNIALLAAAWPNLFCTMQVNPL